MASSDAVPESFYAAVLSGDLEGLSSRERLCAEYAALFASNHLGIDQPFWQRLHANFTDHEIVNLTLSVASCLVFGRFNRVLDIDGGCRVESPLVR